MARVYRAKNPQHYRDRDKRYRDSDPVKIHATYRKWDLQTSFGITPQQYDEMLEMQGGVCAICKAEPHSKRSAGRRLAVDHDHATGQLRRLLCRQCNQAIGLFEENSEWLKRAMDYLEEARYGIHNSV